VENIKQELAKNKEMKESLKKFREEAEKLEQSEALQKARCLMFTDLDNFSSCETC
jgi:import inner membrane translocase subunit TIM44